MTIEETIKELEQQVESLKAGIEELKSKTKQKELKPWKADMNGTYYIIDSDRVVNITETHNSFDDRIYSYGNYYRTKELAEQDKEFLAIRNKLRQYQDILCPGYKFILNKPNWLICYNPAIGQYFVDQSSYYSIISTVYFDTREHAQEVCNIFNNQYINTKD